MLSYPSSHSDQMDSVFFTRQMKVKSIIPGSIQTHKRYPLASNCLLPPSFSIRKLRLAHLRASSELCAISVTAHCYKNRRPIGDPFKNISAFCNLRHRLCLQNYIVSYSCLFLFLVFLKFLIQVS